MSSSWLLQLLHIVTCSSKITEVQSMSADRSPAECAHSSEYWSHLKGFQVLLAETQGPAVHACALPAIIADYLVVHLCSAFPTPAALSNLRYSLRCRSDGIIVLLLSMKASPVCFTKTIQAFARELLRLVIAIAQQSLWTSGLGTSNCAQ